jgi:hypothetical protein
MYDLDWSICLFIYIINAYIHVEKHSPEKNKFVAEIPVSIASSKQTPQYVHHVYIDHSMSQGNHGFSIAPR